MWWLLCREVLYMRKTIQRGQPWDVMVDLFLYRDPEEQEKEEHAIESGRGPIFEEQPDNWTGAPPEEWQAAQQNQEWGSSTGEWGNTADVTGQSWEPEQ
jgi:small subunit ribosomal protein SAe